MLLLLLLLLQHPPTAATVNKPSLSTGRATAVPIQLLLAVSAMPCRYCRHRH